MKTIARLLAVLGTIQLPLLYTVPAHAQASRTWVSGVGDDADPSPGRRHAKHLREPFPKLRLVAKSTLSIPADLAPSPSPRR